MWLFEMSGRIGRLHWWGGQFLILLIWVLALVVFAVSGMASRIASGAVADSDHLIVWIGFVATYCLTGVIHVSFCARRYHDRGKSWVWWFLGFAPIIGPIWQLIELGFLPGQRFDNVFGPARGGAGGDPFLNAVGEVEARYGDASAQAPAAHIWEEAGSGAKTDTPEDATAKALAQNAVRHNARTAAAPGVFGRRGV